MVRISRGIILIIIGIAWYFPGSLVLQIILPFPYGLNLAMYGPLGFFIVGIIFLIKDRKSSRDDRFQ